MNKSIPSNVNFTKFLTGIKQDYILFVDEFEKLFPETSKGDPENKKHSQESFLSFMDGVMTNDNKIIFLLTTNEQVNEYLINRPSRIKFLQEYTELPEELFDLIVEDRLVNKEFKADLEENVSLLNMNIDLLISIVEDINLFDRPFSEFMKFYNYKFEQYRYDVYVTKGTESEHWERIYVSNGKVKYTHTYIGNHTVEKMIKFSKDEIIFQTSTWIEVDDKESQVPMKVRMVPFKGYSKTELTM